MLKYWQDAGCKSRFFLSLIFGNENKKIRHYISDRKVQKSSPSLQWQIYILFFFKQVSYSAQLLSNSAGCAFFLI